MLSERDNRSTDLNVMNKEDNIISLEEHETEEMHIEEKLEDTDKEFKFKATEELKKEIERVRYQNMLIIGHLEQVEEDKIEYEKKIKTLETILKEKAANEITKDLEFKEQEKQVKLLNE